jgi:Spy/CpxP family protein refolding chaperone
MTRKTTLWLALGLFLISTAASAQASPGRQAGARDRLRENLYHLRLLRMTEALDLTEAQTNKIYPVASRIEKEKAEIIRRLGEEMRELRDLVAKPSAKDEDLAARVRAIRELRLGLQQKDREFENSLEANLSEIQIAKYVLFQTDFNRTIGDKLSRARALMRSRGRF